MVEEVDSHEVTCLFAHVVVDGSGRGHVGAESHGGQLAALALFDGRHNLADGIGARK